MKKLIIFCLVIAAACSCTQQKEITKSTGSAPSVKQDSTEYEITIFDNDFDQWYSIHYAETLDRSNEYYRSFNWIGVSNWNQYFFRHKYGNVISSYLSYDNNIDYGIDVNRRLYWYFKYIENNYNVRLLR